MGDHSRIAITSILWCYRSRPGKESITGSVMQKPYTAAPCRASCCSYSKRVRHLGAYDSHGDRNLARPHHSRRTRMSVGAEGLRVERPWRPADVRALPTGASACIRAPAADPLGSCTSSSVVCHLEARAQCPHRSQCRSRTSCHSTMLRLAIIPFAVAIWIELKFPLGKLRQPCRAQRRNQFVPLTHGLPRDAEDFGNRGLRSVVSDGV